MNQRQTTNAGNRQTVVVGIRMVAAKSSSGEPAKPPQSSWNRAQFQVGRDRCLEGDSDWRVGIEDNSRYIKTGLNDLIVKNVISNIADLTAMVASFKLAGKTIGVVPTMGALHRGHLSLVEQSLRRSDETIVTIFVNPAQFGPGEDLNAYPRTLESDLEKLAAVETMAGVGNVWVFAPTVAEIYPDGFSTTVNPPRIAGLLEGEARPSHFSGVATVVLKLLNLTAADLAFFGQKDFQQQLVVTRVVQDLNVPTEICICPIVREADGVALSSRNVYLSPAEREIAQTLSRTLSWVESQIREGQRDGFELIVEMRQQLIDGGVTSVDYAAIADPHTLETMEQIQFPVVAMVAAYVGKTRLIDNVLIESPSSCWVTP